MVGDSNSIINQKKMLEDYANKNGYTNIMHFTDCDTHPVVRIHSVGAIRITQRALKESEDNATDD